MGGQAAAQADILIVRILLPDQGRVDRVIMVVRKRSTAILEGEVDQVA
jgi:hypothetical protein